MWSAKHARRSYDTILKSFVSSEILDFLLSFALHSYLLKQEKGVNKEFSHRGSAVCLFRFLSAERTAGRLLRKFPRRINKQVIMIAFFVFLCSLSQIGLQPARNTQFLDCFFFCFPVVQIYLGKYNFACWRKPWKGHILVIWVWLILRIMKTAYIWFVKEHCFFNSSSDCLFKISNIMGTGFNSFAIDEICVCMKFYLFSLWR